MNKTTFHLTAFLMLTIGFSALAQSGIEKKNIATLGPGETLAYGENCFLLDQDPESFSFVTVTGSGTSKQYYCYGTDGVKTGPVKSPDPKYWSGNENKKAEDCIPNDDPPQVDVSKYFDFISQTLNFQGKAIGPVGQPIQLAVSKDEQHIYAIVLTEEMKMSFFDNTGRKAEITGMPEAIMVSPDGRNAFAKVNGTINPFDPDAYTKMMENPEEMNNPKINLVGMDGTKAGPFLQSDFKDAWFTESGQWVVYANSEITVNGKTLFKTSEYIAPCDLWISSSGNDYAWADYNFIYFKDGTKYPAPLEVKYSTSGGKSSLKWISLEDGKNIVFCKKPF